MSLSIWNLIWNELWDITSLPVLCLFFSCSLGLRYWNRWAKPLKIIVVYLCFNLFIELSARVCSIVWGQNLPLLHLYTLGECALFLFFYREILDARSVFKRFFPWILPTVLSLVVLNTLFLQGIFQFNSYAKTLVQLLIILCALDYAFRFTEEEGAETEEQRALRPINAIILLYYCGSLFIFMSSQFEIETQGALRVLWNINTLLNLIFQLVVLYALWKVIFHPLKSSSSSALAR